ncbi:coiled-coil domain-containing protein 102A isoform X1 [Parasteatoda tepidariorum]|uniref:coiled-coil domain-containing protein 102A isoform X1 n=1 Tax=Parasteatoda tepidariorum TaxID=114398 RepID=UPI001C723EAD|nr:myb-like protein X [Parasteatoda tepidariorum]
MTAQHKQAHGRTEAECEFSNLMENELELMEAELLHLKEIIISRKNDRMMIKQMIPLIEIDSAQESIIEEFCERLERECEKDMLQSDKDGLFSKISKFQELLAAFKSVYQKVFTKEAEKSEFLSGLTVKQRWITYVLELELTSEKQGKEQREKKISEQKKELDCAWKCYERQKSQIEDFRRRIHKREFELRSIITEFKKKEEARKELQFKNSSLNFELLNLRKDLAAFKTDYQKVIGEKEVLKQRLAEVAWNSAEKGEAKAAERTEKQVKLETINETKLNASQRQTSERNESDDDSIEESSNWESELDEILSRLEEGRISNYEQQFKNMKNSEDDNAISRQITLKNPQSRLNSQQNQFY